MRKAPVGPGFTRKCQRKRNLDFRQIRRIREVAWPVTALLLTERLVDGANQRAREREHDQVACDPHERDLGRECSVANRINCTDAEQTDHDPVSDSGSSSGAVDANLADVEPGEGEGYNQMPENEDLEMALVIFIRPPVRRNFHVSGLH